MPDLRALANRTHMSILTQIKLLNLLTESTWNTNDQCLSLDGLGKVDMVAGRVFNEIDAGKRIASFDECTCRAVESLAARGSE